MALEWLDSFGSLPGRALASLRRFREPELAPSLDDFGRKLYDDDLDAWERAKAKMALEELGRWEKMNLAESRTFTGVCSACGGPTVNGKCQYEFSESDRNY